MAEKKISQLPILSEVTGGAILPIVAGDTTYQVSVEELSGYTEELIRAIISGSNTYVGTQTYNGVINATNNLTVAGILSATEITTLNVYTSSFNNLQGFTSSLRNEVNGIEAYTASLKGTTLISGSAQISALGFSAATNGTVSSSAQITELPYIHFTTSSLNVFTGSVQSEVNALKIATSSYVVNSLTSSFVSYGILSQSFANFTSSANTFTGNQRVVGQLQLDNSNNHLDIVTVGGNEFRLTSEAGYGIYFNASNGRRWFIDGTTFDLNSNNSNYDIVRDNVRVFDSLNLIHTYTGSLRSEVNLIEAYTASLKGQAIVSSSTQITNYYKFAETASANTFYGTQTFSGSLNVTGSVNIDNVIKLTPVTPFPIGQAGMLVASASYGFTNLYIYDGSEWKWLVTGSIQ